MDNHEEKIRARAYEIWEHQGFTGDPEDHWLEAERELKAEETTEASQGRSKATVEEAPPAEVVEAREAVGNSKQSSDG